MATLLLHFGYCFIYVLGHFENRAIRLCFVVEWIQQDPLRLLKTVGVASPPGASSMPPLLSPEEKRVWKWMKEKGCVWGPDLTSTEFDYASEQRNLYRMHEQIANISYVMKQTDGTNPKFWLHYFRDYLKSTTPVFPSRYGCHILKCVSSLWLNTTFRREIFSCTNLSANWWSRCVCYNWMSESFWNCAVCAPPTWCTPQPFAKADLSARLKKCQSFSRRFTRQLWSGLGPEQRERDDLDHWRFWQYGSCLQITCANRKGRPAQRPRAHWMLSN